MHINDIPKGWWLNVTILAWKDKPEWICGIIREGKTVWISENCKSGFNNPQDAYEWGMDWIKKYIELKEIKNKIK